MSCPETRTTMRYLRGELSERDAGRSLDHLRHCPPCRDAFRFGATALATVEPAGPADPESAPPPASPPFRGGLASMLLPATPSRGAGGSRIIMVAAVAAVLYMVFKPGSPGGEGGPASDPLAAAVAAGTPVVRSPAGEQPARPRIVSAVLPPAVSTFRVLVLDSAGRIVHERDHVPGEGGCTAAGIEVPCGSGPRLQALSVAAPFPGADALPLDPGRTYGVTVALPGGHLAASSTFRIAPGP